MKKIQYAFPALLCILLLSACHSLPKHAKYIPEDAAVVVGLNTGELSKKVAWSAITGSKILDEMKESAKDSKSKEAMNDIENSGIDFGSTLYFYAKPDKRFDHEAKMSIVAPLADAQKWAAFVKKVYPAANIIKVKDRSEAMLDDKAYAAWTGDVLMISNTAVIKNTTEAEVPSTEDVVAVDSAVSADDTTAAVVEMATPSFTPVVTEKVDMATTAAEMEAAFGQKEEQSIAANKRFKKLEGDGHDVTIFVAYGGLMDSYASKADMGMMSSMMGGGMLWKNSAMATGLDFEKGKIEGIMHYYPSDSLKDVAREYGADNLDKDILSRIPGQNLNMVAGYHLSPKATKMLLDKMNLSGMANLFLMQKGLSIDEILNAFTGDMVVAINNMGTKPKPATTTTNDEENTTMSYQQNMDFVYAMKLNNKESFKKLFALVTQEGGLQQVAANTYAIPGMKDVSLVIGDKYIAVSNVAANAQAFLQQKGGNIPDAVKNEITGHPIGAFVDIKMIMNATAGMTRQGMDGDKLKQAGNIFSNAVINGGEFKGDANEYHLSINLVNKEENSLLQLLQMTQQMAKADKANATVGL